MTNSHASAMDFLFPKVPIERWQMLPGEQMALTGVLARIRPELSLEIGVYYGGSLSLTAQFAKRAIGVDIDPDVVNRFTVPPNVTLRVGDSKTLVPEILAEITASGERLGFILIDADHTADGVRRDIELVLSYSPIAPMVIVIHDSGNPSCREGILTAAWAQNPHVHYVQADFMIGQITQHNAVTGRGEVWGGFALAYLSPDRRIGDLAVQEGGRGSLEPLWAA